MPEGLKRFQHSGQSHFLTFSCYGRLPFLQDERLRDLFLHSLERTHRLYRFRVYGYVVMPEHVHLLVSESEVGVLATAIQALKISVARSVTRYRSEGGMPFWMRRYHDCNVRNYRGFVERLRYLHRNPVKRGLVARPEDWSWSSFRHYATGEAAPVEIESQWTADRRSRREPRLLQIRD